MLKRIIMFFSFLMFSLCIMIFSLNNLSTASQDKLSNAATSQQSYKLKVADIRGTIYDCNLNPMVNNHAKIVAAILPNLNIFNFLSNTINKDKSELFKLFSSSKTPFIMELDRKIEYDGIECFNIPVRYKGIIHAPHIIGYLSGSGKGVSGIEKSFDSYLSNEGSSICVKYNIDASNKILSGGKSYIDNKYYMYSKGVVLNIDNKIQSIAEEISNKYISQGAVIITEVPNCEIRASVSLPSFTPQNISNYLSDENSPLLNRILCQYDLGSVFKVITAATALENGISPSLKYDCKGSYNVQDHDFKCFNGISHGEINMEEAIAYSCNGYFIKLSESIGANKLLEMSKKFGLGESITLADDIVSSKGILPSEESISNPKILANLSFGQGKLSVTPVQISALINAIASGGIYTNPKLVKGLVNSGLEYISEETNINNKRVISESTSQKLQQFMSASVEYGTSKKGKPTKVSAAAKTSTAQTGIIVNGNKIIQAWYAGFFPVENPKYCIVILSEGGTGGGKSCGPVFQEIADSMYDIFLS